MNWRSPVNPDRWQRLKELFEDAVDKDDAGRAAFLSEACLEDPGLRKEVEALLNSRDDDNFLEKPAYEVAPELFEGEMESAFVGRKLGTYEIKGTIGHGGMGVVYLARDTKLERLVAIKMLSQKYTRDEQQRERLRREARAAARLSHPGVATVYSLDECEEGLYMVSEYVRGQTLHQIMAGGLLPFSSLLDIAIQIARALTVAHEQGIVHRDLKPENIIQSESGIIKILDFGLARVEPKADTVSNPNLTKNGMFLGTPAYASPEQLLGSEVDRNADIFSFGILLYELAAGKHPFGTSNSLSTVARILEAEAADLTQMNAAIPKEFDRVVRRCLKKSPEHRYHNTRDLLAELERLTEGKNSELRKPSSAFWWWQLHQACAGFGYYGMLYPLWRVKAWLGGIEGSLLFFPTLVAVGVSANLRLHLWFTAKFYVSELADQRRKVSRWIRWADVLFVSMLAITAIRIHSIHAIIASLLMGVAIYSLVAFSLIEPTTTKAALDK
jgi:eukaryotic-like serine/threonine-protein kinase